jgi:hypothetical protein
MIAQLAGSGLACDAGETSRFGGWFALRGATIKTVATSLPVRNFD